MGNAYSRAGVDVEAGYEVVERIKKHVKRTERLGVMGAIGGFGGCFDLSQFDLKEPVLVSGTDGVGTKLMVAIQADKHDTIGIDCVAMCVNDIVAQGAEPLYFLDYIATGKNVPARLEQVVAGVAEGIAEKRQMITGEKIQAGDVLVGLPSSGIHSNGYSLVRKVFFETNSFALDEKLPELSGKLSDEILTPTRIYVEAVLPLVKKELVNGIAHVTGGGFVENLPRMLPEKLACEIELGSWPVLPIFNALEKYGEIPEMEMYEIFNMGIGMVLAVAPEKLAELQADLKERNEATFVIGKVTEKKDTAIVFKGAKA